MADIDDNPIIRNQRYQPWAEIVLGMFVAASLAGMCAVLMVKRFSMINFVLAGGAVGFLALVIFEVVLPKLGSVRELKLGYFVQTAPIVWRYPMQALTRITFAPDPAEDYAERDKPDRLFEVTIEVDSGRAFRMIVHGADAGLLRQWAVARGIAVCEGSKEDSPARED